MARLLPLLILLGPVLQASPGAAQQPSFAGTVEVTSRLPGERVPLRVTVVLDRDEIARLPVDDLAGLLSYVTGGGLVRRSPVGMQADAQLRGATFEQVAVLVDGVRVNDAQTGHFNLNLPLPLASIERIEVLLGPGSALHGPDAFGGVVSITTGAPRGAAVRVTAGEHGRAAAAGSASLGRGVWLALSHDRSDGFRPSTEHETSDASLGWNGASGPWSLHLTAGASRRRFGAWAFYSDRFPNQWESNSIALITAAAVRPVGAAVLTVRAGGRGHDDEFVLDRDRPLWYSNRHESRQGLVQASLAGASGRLAWALGLEAEEQRLDSSRLGRRRRDRVATFAEASFAAGRWRAAAQLRADRLSSIGWQTSPGAGAEVDLGNGASLSVHGAHSFRQPSFTDLYYDSPASIGNPDLEPEHAWTGEALLRLPTGPALLELSAFRREGRDLIDFVLGPDQVWRAANHARARTDGVQLGVWRPGAAGRVSDVRASVAWLDSEIDADPASSRYVLAHPRLEATLTGRLALPFDVSADLGWRFRKPVDAATWQVLDVRLSRRLGHALRLEVEASNLLDRSYHELAGVPMPGRWLTTSIIWTR